MWWFRADRTGPAISNGIDRHPRRPRSTGVGVLSADGDRSPSTLDRLFRGVTPGEQLGPYLSQFLLIGNSGVNAATTPIGRLWPTGFVSFGCDAHRPAGPHGDRRRRPHDRLGLVPRRAERGRTSGGRESFDAGHRFITTPRDLATYVHYDALYQAYLNACLILLGTGTPGDPGLPFQLPDWRDKQQGFAQFGGPAHPHTGDRGGHACSQGSALPEVQRTSPHAARSRRRLDVPASHLGPSPTVSGSRSRRRSPRWKTAFDRQVPVSAMHVEAKQRCRRELVAPDGVP